ncbi:MAG: chemotaxis protein CheC [Armatimonadota bacterium]
MKVLGEKIDSSFTSFFTVAKAGVKKASTSIRSMSANTVRLEIVSAGVAPTSRLSEIAGNPEDLVVGVYVAVTGEMPGHALLIFPYESALLLVDLISDKPPGSTKNFDEMEESVIQEVGNIITSSYLNAMSEHYDRLFLPRPPVIALDMAAAVIDSVLVNTGRVEEYTISVVTKFAGRNQLLRGFFLYIPEVHNS